MAGIRIPALLLLLRNIAIMPLSIESKGITTVVSYNCPPARSPLYVDGLKPDAEGLDV